MTQSSVQSGSDLSNRLDGNDAVPGNAFDESHAHSFLGQKWVFRAIACLKEPEHHRGTLTENCSARPFSAGVNRQEKHSIVTIMELLLVTGTATLLGGAHFAQGQSPSALDLHLFAGVQITPTNMVFIPPNTFRMGSPTNELDRQANEGPQTTVALTRGYWIGKYEVTQAEYLEVTGTNPSEFPGDLNQPVSSVSWPDATNYCWTLTQRELAASRIPSGSRFRLPTEAEWECAARAGTSTRFSYNEIGWKVMRGGAFDFGPSSCRSASRNFFGNHPALIDWNLGFRVVLVCEHPSPL